MFERLLRCVSRTQRRRQVASWPQQVERLDSRYLLSAIVALTADDHLLQIDTDAASVILADTPITGVTNGQTILGIDVRPATAELFGVSSNGELYVINPNTGVATFRATLTADAADVTAPFTGLVGTDFGIDFNPSANRLRVVSDAGQNLRINVNTGAVTTDTALAFAEGTPHDGESPTVVDIAYSNNIAGGITNPTTLYGLDTNIHILVRQDPPNAGTLTKIAPFGKEGALPVGFDIAPTGTAWVAVNAIGLVDESFLLVEIDLATGIDSSHGTIGNGLTRIKDIAVVSAVEFTVTLFAIDENAGNATFFVTRTDVSVGTATVNLEILGGTATAGSDFTASSRSLTLGAGPLALGAGETRAISIPIIDDTLLEGDETIVLRLSNISGRAVLGAKREAVMRINASDLNDRKGPRVLNVLETGPSRGINGFRATFSEDINAVRAQDIRNYTFNGIDTSGERTSIPLSSAAYDFVHRAVTVTTAQLLIQSQFAQIEFVFNGDPGGLSDRAGNLLNSNRITGAVGKDSTFAFHVVSGTTATFTDLDGDEVSIMIAEGGSLDAIVPIGARATQFTQFWILDPIALRSRLSGTVTKRTVAGNGLVVIAEIIGLDKKELTPLLTNTSFRINTRTFSPNATGIG